MGKNNNIQEDTACDDIILSNAEKANQLDKVVEMDNKPIFKSKSCRVLFYNKYSNILAFDFDGISVQTTVTKPLDIKSGYIDIQYTGNSKDGYKFKA